jgi:DNA-binding transcriptional ArsR family regulator
VTPAGCTREGGAPAVDAALAALADPVRRRVVDRLRRGPERAGDLARALSLAPPAMSKHLRVLRRSRLVEEVRVEDDARVKLYRLRPEPFRDLGRWLEEVQSCWVDQLDAFRAHVDARSGDEG